MANSENVIPCFNAESLFYVSNLDASQYTLHLEIHVDNDGFKALSTDLERFNFVYNQYEGRFPELRVHEVGKNDDEAKHYKEEGDAEFSRNLYGDALRTYARSIAGAESKELLANLYATRSALLFKMCQYRECLNDINRAFANNYAGQNRKELIERKKKATKALKPTEPYHGEVPKFSDEEKNPKIECASNLVEIKVSKRYGRHVVATKDIKFGDILAVEKAYVCDLIDETVTHCSQCLELCYDLIPCDFCSSEILFCSNACKKAAYDSYHKYECKILVSKYIWEKPFIIALRAAFMAKDDFDNIEQLSTFEEGDVYRSNRYKEVHNLAINKSLSVDKMIDIAKRAAKIFNFVKKHTSFFDDFEDKEAAEDKFKVILMRQLQIVQVNKLQLWECLLNTQMNRSSSHFSINRYAYGLFPFYSLFNHSCYPNVEAFFYGSTAVLRAVLPIKKGEQCFANYGCHFESGPTSMRQMQLSDRYGFKCKCRACTEDFRMTLEDHIRSLSEFGQPHIATLYKQLISAQPKFKQIGKKLIGLVLEEIQHIEPNYKGLYNTYKTYARACFEIEGNTTKALSVSTFSVHPQM